MMEAPKMNIRITSPGNSPALCIRLTRSSTSNWRAGCWEMSLGAGLIRRRRFNKERRSPDRYVFSAKGAVFTVAWGSAPGSRKCKPASAESAIQSRAFSVHYWSHAAIVPESRLQRSFTIRSQS